MRDRLLRVLIFTYNYAQISEGPNIILRKHTLEYEIDLKLNGFDDLENHLRNMEYSEIYLLPSEENDVNEPPIDIFNFGISLMTEEKYWIAHEYFEKLWKFYNEPTSKFFHSVVLFCVAMVHHQMGRESIAYRIFDNARNEMSEFLDQSLISSDFCYPLPHMLIEKIGTFGKNIIAHTGLNLKDPSESFL